MVGLQPLGNESLQISSLPLQRNMSPRPHSSDSTLLDAYHSNRATVVSTAHCSLRDAVQYMGVYCVSFPVMACDK